MTGLIASVWSGSDTFGTCSRAAQRSVELWKQPPKQQSVATLLGHFEKKVSAISRGPLVRFTIGKTTPRLDLLELGSGLRTANQFSTISSRARRQWWSSIRRRMSETKAREAELQAARQPRTDVPEGHRPRRANPGLSVPVDDGKPRCHVYGKGGTPKGSSHPPLADCPSVSDGRPGGHGRLPRGARGGPA